MQVETCFILSVPEIADVENWSTHIGLDPSDYVIKGNKFSANPRSNISPESYWVFEIKRQEEPSMEIQLTKLIDQVYAKKKEIGELVAKLRLKVTCDSYVWPDDDATEILINFSSGLMQKMTELGISFTLTRY